VSCHRRLARNGKTDGARAYDQNLQAEVSLPKFHAALSRRDEAANAAGSQRKRTKQRRCAIFPAVGSLRIQPHREQFPIL
jgi:hypothetical protein